MTRRPDRREPTPAEMRPPWYYTLIIAAWIWTFENPIGIDHALTGWRTWGGPW